MATEVTNHTELSDADTVRHLAMVVGVLIAVSLGIAGIVALIV